MKKNHPNLNSDFFEDINTKEKAYWLGFLYADGCIYTNKSEYKFVEMTLSKDDKIMIKKFTEIINGDFSQKYDRINRNQFTLRINDDKMFDDLESHGCVQRKSLIIQLPKLDSRELYLAFLLGFYDGDGTQNTTKITSGSRKFLEQIKEKFELSFKIQESYSHIKINDEDSYGHGYYVCLGSTLFNEMMDNYQDSLPRKRKYYNTNKIRNENIKKNGWNKCHSIKFKITKEELEKLVWEKTSEQIAKDYGVSGSLITKRCNQWNIDKPSRGYWAKFKIKM